MERERNEDAGSHHRGATERVGGRVAVCEFESVDRDTPKGEVADEDPEHSEEDLIDVLQAGE